ncbi:MAG: Gfo/Idh/MocA family protein [Candidatus Brocadiia bacterium]
MAKKMLNVAVVGLGMGRNHLRSYHAYERSRVAAICDIDAQRVAQYAEECDIPEGCCFADYKKLIRSTKELGLDAVSIALPNSLHAPVSVAASKAGLHVLCEKPMATSVREARRMLRAATEAGKKLMINFSYRFTPQGQALRRVVESGAVGDIYFGRTAWHRRRGLPGFGGWFGQKALAGGGPIIDLGVHRLDLAMWLMGNPRPVTVSGSTYSHVADRIAREQGKKFDVEDLGCALVRFEDGATLIVEASWAGFTEKREDMSTQLLGTRGGILHRNVGQGYDFEALVYTERDGTLWESRLQQSVLETPKAYEDFVDACLDGREPLAPGQHGLDVQLVLDAIYKSARKGREVRIPARK